VDVYRVIFNGEMICRSRTPLLTAARCLLSRGLARPNDRIVMRYTGSRDVTLSARVGAAAQLRVEEGDRPPRFRPWVDRDDGPLCGRGRR
jgi:hypothetical protein